MKVLDFPLLADENIHPDVIAFLREAGFAKAWSDGQSMNLDAAIAFALR